MTAAPDIFLSYNREDAAIAKTYATAFEREGLTVWWDVTLRSGEAYDEVTEAALREAKAVVVLWSPRSVVSRWVRAEATIADRSKTLMPVTIELCDKPVMFELTQTADLSLWRGDADDKAWLVFLDDVRRKVGWSTPRPALPSPAPATPASTTGGIPFVAVLPITYRAGDEALEVLAEDLTGDITRELASNGFINVIAASTLAAWRNKAIDHRALGLELRACYLIEGRLQRTGDAIRLTLQLIETATGGMLRSVRLTRQLADIGASPEELPVAAACEFGEHLVHIETSRAIAKQGTLTGWEHVLRALAFSERLGSEGLRSALMEARAAVTVAPDLGLAHALLATSICTDRVLGLREINDTERREIHDHIKRAMQLDGDNSVILGFIASAYALLDDAEASLRLARRGVALAPNSPSAHFALGHACFATERTAEAITTFNEQLLLASHDSSREVALVLLGISLFVEGEPTEAESAFDRALALHPGSSTTLMLKAIAAAQQGHELEAKAAVQRARESEPGMVLDQYLRQLIFYPRYRERLAGAAAIFCRLWDETEGGNA